MKTTTTAKKTMVTMMMETKVTKRMMKTAKTMQRREGRQRIPRRTMMILLTRRKTKSLETCRLPGKVINIQTQINIYRHDTNDAMYTALEMSRKIYDANPTDMSDLHLAQVYFRLGDLQRFNGAFDSAIEEYQKCIELREAVLPDDHRGISEAIYLLAITHVYNSSEVPQFIPCFIFILHCV